MRSFNERGFSILEVMVSAGLIGGLAVMLMTQQQTASKIQTKMSYNQDLNTVTTMIQTQLGKMNNCTATVAGKKVGDNLTDGIKVEDPANPNTFKTLFKPITKNASGNTHQLESSKLKITEIKLVKSDPTDPDSLDAIQVKFEAGRLDDSGRFIASEMMGSGHITKRFLIQGKQAADGSYENCFSESQNLVETSCVTQGGTWDEVNQRCKFTHLPQCISTESTCGTVYQKMPDNTTRWITVFGGERTCTTVYNKHCWGSDKFTRTCTCSTPNCTCYTGDAPTCYSIESTSCEDSKTTSIPLYKCCRPLEPGEAPDSSYPAEGSSGGGGSGCFVAGTQIAMFDGSLKNIEDVVSGDELIDGSQRKVTVQKLVRYQHQGKIFSINGGSYFFTPNHPFLTIEGWKSLEPQESMKESPGLEVKRMKVGDILIKRHGLETIFSLDGIESDEPVYNFSVTDSHEYIADEYVVHNIKVPEEAGP
jgi:type II secretory pathway pseudopilin PulG